MTVLSAAALIVALLLAATGLTRIALLCFDRERAASLYESILIGLPLLGGLLYLVEIFSITVPLLSAVVVPLAVAGLVAIVRTRPELELPRPRLARDVIGMTLVLGMLLTAALAAVAPPFMKDEVAYHLAVPAVWVAESRVVELPLMSHSYFPNGFESLYPWFLLPLGKVAGGIAIHFLHLIVTAACTALMVRMTRSWVLGAAVLCIPVLIIPAGAAMLEWPLVGVTLVLLAAMRTDEPEGALAGLSIAAGFFLKYTFPVIALVVVVATIRKRHARALIAPLLLGLLIGSLFYVRNLIWTGNPVEPFLAGETAEIARYRANRSLVPLPVGYVFDPVQFDEATGLSVWILVVAGALAAARARRSERRLVMASTLALVAMMIPGPSARILVPFMVLAAIGAWEVISSQQERAASVGYLGALLLFLAAVQLILAAAFVVALKPLESIGRANDWIAARRQSHGFVVWLNGVIEPGDRPLVLGVSELYWVDGSPRGGGNSDESRVARYLGAPGLASRLHSDGVTHIAIEASAVSELPPPSEPLEGELVEVSRDGSRVWRLR